MKELLVYGADVHLKDARGFSFHNLVTGHEAYKTLHMFIAQAANESWYITFTIEMASSWITWAARR